MKTSFSARFSGIWGPNTAPDNSTTLDDAIGTDSSVVVYDHLFQDESSSFDQAYSKDNIGANDYIIANLYQVAGGADRHGA